MDYIITQDGVLPHPPEDELQSSPEATVYEVIRIIGGKALFLEDHFERLISSAKMIGFQLTMGFSEFKQHIADLNTLNDKKEGNVKFILTKVGRIYHWSFSFIPHHYPSVEDYQQGVSTGLLFAERQNPNAKIIQNTVREKASQMIAEKELYEVLLIDKNWLITEGSRSNVFFVKGNLFYTAPASQVLVGITRNKVLECIKELGFTIIEKAVLASGTGMFDAVFLTGTSPKILPVNSIGTVQFSVNNTFVKQLMNRYDSMIETYLRG